MIKQRLNMLRVIYALVPVWLGAYHKGWSVTWGDNEWKKKPMGVIGSATYKNLGGGGGTSENINILIQYCIQGRRQNFGGGGNISKNFIHEFLSSPVLQWRLQNFGWEKTFSTNLLIKDFWKIYKTFAQKFKISPKFFKNKI